MLLFLARLKIPRRKAGWFDSGVGAIDRLAIHDFRPLPARVTAPTLAAGQPDGLEKARCGCVLLDEVPDRILEQSRHIVSVQQRIRCHPDCDLPSQFLDVNSGHRSSPLRRRSRDTGAWADRRTT